MRQEIEITHAFLKVHQQHIAYRIYRFPRVKTGRKMLCLHGAGVAGELTYGFILPFLNQWSEILVPDLRGMGETQSQLGGEPPFNVWNLVEDQVALLADLGWQDIDVCGYSLGGLVSMLLKQMWIYNINKTYLIEPALLDNESIQDTREFRHHYKDVARDILESEDKTPALVRFLDLVSPKRSKNASAQALVVQRLARRPVGFAQALNAVSQAVDVIDRKALIAAQQNVISFVGAKSYQPMCEYHQLIEKQREDWNCVVVPGADHSLPFQKPKRIITVLNESLAS